MEYSPGKFMGFRRISNNDGIFQMLALDQRQSLFKLLKEYGLDRKKQEDAIKKIKKTILKTLSQYASAVLVDGEYAFPDFLSYIHPNTGIILSIEKSGYTEVADGRVNELFREDAIELAKKWGCDAIKLLIYWNDDADEKIKNAQKKFVKKVGGQAKDLDLLFILEIVTYGVSKGQKKAILSAIKNFSSEGYGVDLFKIEPFIESVNASEVFEASLGKPWVVLSGGVEINRFLPILENNVLSGASGFLVGRVVWKNIIKYFNNEEKMEFYLKNTGLNYLSWLKEKSKYSLPWYMTPYFGGYEQINIRRSFKNVVE